jgi:hypothetical protein
MSRLYYPKKSGDLRLASESDVDITEVGKKVGKLIPSELVTAYTGLVTLTLNVKHLDWRPWLFGFAFVLCLVMTPIYLNHMAEAGRPKRNHLIVSTFAFAVWAYFVSGQQVLPAACYDTAMASIFLLVFSVVSAAVPLDK